MNTVVKFLLLPPSLKKPFTFHIVLLKIGISVDSLVNCWLAYLITRSFSTKLYRKLKVAEGGKLSTDSETVRCFYLLRRTHYTVAKKIRESTSSIFVFNVNTGTLAPAGGQ